MPLIKRPFVLLIFLCLLICGSLFGGPINGTSVTTPRSAVVNPDGSLRWPDVGTFYSMNPPPPSLYDPAGTGATAAAAAQAYAVQRGNHTGTQPASSISGGIFSPGLLGAGTPGTGTVLRGDGTWVGTTPTGNTIPATGSLFMGDGAGNAASVASGADLYRVLKARLESLQAAQAAPINLLPTTGDGYNGYEPGNPALNADGTITIPANGHLAWRITPGSKGSNLYGYAVATADQPPGAVTIHGHYGADLAATDATLAPGVYRSQFVSSNNYDTFEVYVANNTGAAVSIYYPVLAFADTGLSLLASCADYTPVAAPTVADLDFTRFGSAGGDRVSRYQLEQRTTLAADSVGGSNANDGTLYAPTLALPSVTMANSNTLGLYRGSTFRASLPISSLGTSHGVLVQDVALGSLKALPVVSALDPVPAGSLSSQGDHTFTYQWTPEAAVTTSYPSHAGYDNVYVVEINTATEAAQPIASRRRMPDAASDGAVAATAGSAYVTAPTGGATLWQVHFHPSDNQTPGSGSVYRYEVIARYQPANWGSSNFGDGALSGLVLVGGSSGYGCLGGPASFAGDRLAFLHSTTHSAVIGGGSLSRSVFYEMGHGTSASGQDIPLTWYTSNGAGLSWLVDRCLFYANVGQDPANCLISHCGGTNYDRGDVADSAFLGVRRADGSLQGTVIDYYTVNSGTIARVYAQGAREVFGNVMPTTLETKGCVFRGVHRALVYGKFHDNVVQEVNGAGPGDNNNRSPVAVSFGANGASATNNLFWARTETNSGLGDDQAGGISTGTTGGMSAPATGCTVARNIIVLDPANTTLKQTYASLPNDGTSAHTIDYNLVINLAKGGLAASNGSTNFPDWNSYVSGTGHDQHSFYLDLSADPRGLRAVFVDPANGDFRWAQTETARRCAAYCRTNQVGPAAVTSHWPTVPSVDDAVRLLGSL